MRALMALAGLAVLGSVAYAEPPDAASAKAEAREIYVRAVGLDTSVEGKKVPELAQWLADRFKAGGFPAADVHVLPMGDTAVLLVRYRGDGSAKAKPILFLAHMDVVTAHRSDWTRDPFTLVEENGYFYGRGSLDNKSGLTGLTASFLRLKREGFKPARDLILVFSGDEETSGVTTKTLIAQHRDLLAEAEFALNSDAGQGTLDEATGAPHGYSLQTAEKTFASFALSAHNPGGHSSQPRKDNAIYDIVDALSRVRAYAFPVQWNDTTIASLRLAGSATAGPLGVALTKFAGHPGDAAAAKIISASPFFVGQIRTTCIPTLLEAGHADNALPQSAVATLNCRIFPGVKIATVQARLQKLTGKKIEIKPLDEYMSSDASPLRDDVLAAVKKAVSAIHPGTPVTPSMSAGASDGVFYRASGIATYGVGEVFLKDSDDFAHGLNERLPVKTLYDGLLYWDALIRAIAAAP
jgi:acetylornithine deacetylase/succinyl-diaminopimelate desuccinylase-like protein